jgi:hypothetical protein
MGLVRQRDPAFACSVEDTNPNADFLPQIFGVSPPILPADVYFQTKVGGRTVCNGQRGSATPGEREQRAEEWEEQEERVAEHQSRLLRLPAPPDHGGVPSSR